MRKNKLFIIILVFLFSLVLVSTKKVSAKSDLDLIEKYDITVEPDFHDGTLKIRVELVWHVLNDTTNGPLTWIKVGVPNSHVEALKKESSNISDIRYYDNGGAYIRIDLDRKYYQDETLTIKFSWVQSYMYFIDGNVIRYDYNPGWFGDINVSECNVRWLAKKVANIEESSLEPTEENGYYVWSSPLGHGEYIKVNLFYDKSSFSTIDPEKQFTNQYISNRSIIVMSIVIGGLLIFIIGMIIYSYQKQDPYLRERGFVVHSPHYFYYHYPIHYHQTGSRVSKDGTPINPVNVHSGSHYGGGCACACACACAGGGRAGCSMKDFYHTNLSSEKVINILKDND